ncbi:hypothetical protein CVT25_011691 [Psilocybe cyanescens]|uniref:Terpene synthase n=1 Tax=Psilocybe cyanescens TaxID=93625 RepID=A0A409WIP0_PSICY|nr:hypothetical protein CVT25_011691 [Psilocybe cyanescens]
MCKESASLAEEGNKHRCLINIEDLGHKYPSSLAGFQAQILQQQRPEGKVLQSLLDSLTTFYRFWDPIPANCMSHSVLEFVNGSLLEQAPNVNNMKLSSAAKRWPYFLRRKTGISAAFAFAIFPKELNIDMSVYIQAIEDTVLFIDIFNDVLSFYKEYLSGERNNYVYNRARVNEKSTMETLQSVVDDALAAHSRAKKILEHTEAFLPWKSFLDGYIIPRTRAPKGESERHNFRILSRSYQHLLSLLGPYPGKLHVPAAMDFVNGCLLEQLPTIREMKLSSDAKSWPYSLRRKTGASGVYAFAIFPKVLKIDISIYIQVIDDIVLFIDLLNDVLSFHKEYLAGERNNYVYNRAHVDHTSIPETLQSIADDVLAAHARVTKVLQYTEGYLPWMRFVNGYIAFHVTLKRYRLGDLGF